MNTTHLILVVVGMGIVTFLPRLFPVFILEKLSLPPLVERWLKSIPYAALGALIFPGILTIDPSNPWIGVTGGIVACVLALLRLPILAVIAGSILTAWLANAWF
ncbi:AzlD domain-containing protein [Lihuaxuella thermophila]|uniref:Branched-chain amino acid transport protein n=1 Tax=Lihuaxuella thermophila TaxID=1173111 RepID=A0A1H8AC01_9BACL|nr:AzlD domain-containing protein [Lihuaxuella thermophila]SEM67338.1 Branched-chain amino acid transport protein [Lihuaxuella thermophila]